MHKNKKAKLSYKKLLSFSALVLFGAIGLWFYQYSLRSLPSTNTTPSKTASSSRSTLNLKGPTEQEKKSGDEVKSQVVKQEEARNAPLAPNTRTKNQVTPIITYADQYGQGIEVGAYINSVFEDNGACTLSLEKDGIIKTVRVNAVKNVSSTDCPAMIIQRSTIDAGAWKATVTYNSITSEGPSTTRIIEVK